MKEPAWLAEARAKAKAAKRERALLVQEFSACPKTLKAVAERVFDLMTNGADLHLVGSTASALHRLACGSLEDVVIFDNCGGVAFTVWGGKNAKLIWEHYGGQQYPPIVYCCQVDGNVLRWMFPIRSGGSIGWVTEEGLS